MMLAWKGFVLAGFLIAAVSCDAFGFSEQSAEVEFENERRETCELQLFDLHLEYFCNISCT